MAPELTPFDAVGHFDQPERGYRFSADSLILAGFAGADNGVRAADFGAGCGVVGLTALERGALKGFQEMIFLERERHFQPHLENNLRLYQPRTKVRLRALMEDWREVQPPDFGGSLDYIMVNPPYFRADQSRPSPEPTRDAARREKYGGLDDLCLSLVRLLTRPTGRAAVMLPAFRRADLTAALTGVGLKVMRESSVSAEDSGQARLILIEAGLQVEPQFS